MTNYVCSELDQNSSNGDGISGSGVNYVMCKTWVMQDPSLLQSLQITKADSLAISISLAGFFGVIIGFLIIVKAGKSI